MNHQFSLNHCWTNFKSKQCISYLSNCCYYSSYILYLKRMVYLLWRIKFQNSQLLYTVEYQMLRYQKNISWRKEKSAKWFSKLFQNCPWVIWCIQECIEEQKSNVVGLKFIQKLPNQNLCQLQKLQNHLQLNKFLYPQVHLRMCIIIFFEFNKRCHILDS